MQMNASKIPFFGYSGANANTVQQTLYKAWKDKKKDPFLSVHGL